MRTDWLERTQLLIGSEKIEALTKANVLVVGMGGVGSYAAEFLARAGVGKMTIVDGDAVDLTNTNRQLPAMFSTVGQSKALLMGQRLQDINPELDLTVVQEFLEPERTWELIKESKFTYVLDCIDSLTPKLNLMMACRKLKVKSIHSMGAGGKIDPSKVRAGDLSKTCECVFAQHIRKRLKRLNISPKGFKVVYSTEPYIRESMALVENARYKKSYYGTISYIPALFGLHQAAYVIRKIAGEEVHYK